ncbi:AAA family ATPase [Modicisalibacter coralii]|uniref:AAA family ATPase n=1 Tax=Modicisalibacter coralii TaxID=2304602 RepID=UPI00100BAACB|nr:AAA family ATPase [Halomonas coralii]
MKLNIDDPRELYRGVNAELDDIISELATESDDEQLNGAQREAHSLLREHRSNLQDQLEALEANAEWDTFTIAFYGETGAGKSTIIETMRILLKEDSKLKDQKAFRDFQGKYELTGDRLGALQYEAERLGREIEDLREKCEETSSNYEQLSAESRNKIVQYRELVLERKRTASLWQKFLHLFRETEEELALAREEQQLCKIETERESELSVLNEQKIGLENQLAETRDKLQEFREHLPELEALSDGGIIGDGRSDFTRRTQRFDFSVAGQEFTLLDVPGIEGTERLIAEEIEKALQAAHAVFYVTNQPAPPQTGDQERRKGTLEKIKMHLGASTEVWCVFNKKVINSRYALKDRPLISEDEHASLQELEEKMEEQLGSHFQGVRPLTSLPAFLAATDHFAPDSQNARRRKKALSEFETDLLIELSGVEAFIRFIQDSVLEDSQQKIQRANLFKVKDALDKTTVVLDHVRQGISELAADLRLGEQSSKKQIRSGFSSFRKRLESSAETSIERFSSDVLNEVYSEIDDDISNDAFKAILKQLIKTHQERLNESLKKAMAQQIERFKKETENIVKRFEDKSRELTDIYTTIASADIDRDFDLKLDIDNGLRLTNLLAVIAGGALLWWNPAGWLVIGMGAASIAIGAYKAVRGFLSSSYKKSQQRKAADENLRNITGQLRESLQESLEQGLPEMKEKVTEIEQALAIPAGKARAHADLINQSNTKIKTLSSMIEASGAL